MRVLKFWLRCAHSLVALCSLTRKMETTATDKDAAAAGDDLHALRKYIGASMDDGHVSNSLLSWLTGFLVR